MPSITRERESKRWQTLYSTQEKLRSLFKEPYGQAIGSVIAGTIDFVKKNDTQTGHKFNILVMGGGKGRFSRDTLPFVIKELRNAGSKVRLEVTETDIASVIKHAPTRRKLQADMTALPFKDKAFDLVLSESSLNQPGPKQLGQVVGEIKRVLTPKDASFTFKTFHQTVPIGCPLNYGFPGWTQ